MGTRVGSVSEVNAALARIQRLEADRNVPGLMAELDSPLERGRYSIIRGHAARALGRLRDRRAVPNLIDLASDPSDVARMDALYALGDIGAPEGIGALRKALEDPAELPRMTAAEGSGRAAAREAIPDLRSALAEDSSRWVRLAAAEALVQLGDSSSFQRIVATVDSMPWRIRRNRRWRRLAGRAAA